VVPPAKAGPEAADGDELDFVVCAAVTALLGATGRAVAAEVIVWVETLWEKTPPAASAPTAIPASATTASRISASGLPERFGGGLAGGGVAFAYAGWLGGGGGWGVCAHGGIGVGGPGGTSGWVGAVANA
jgi:hypothetical protein